MTDVYFRLPATGEERAATVMLMACMLTRRNVDRAVPSPERYTTSEGARPKPGRTRAMILGTATEATLAQGG